MKRLAFLILAVASPAAAQPADPHAHHRPAQTAPATPAPKPADPHAEHGAPAQPADPHAHHTAPAPTPQPVDPHAGHGAPAPPADPHAGHGAPPAAAIPATPAPPVPTDREADRHYGRADMDRAREILRREHGDLSWSKVMLEMAEVRPGDGADGYAWEGSASFGGDIHRFVLKTEGEGAGALEEAEAQALYSRAVSPFFNAVVGVRQDFEPRGRTYATVGIDGLAPYFFEIEAAAFLSDKGDLTARLEGALDWRITQRLILEPRAELNLAAQDVPALGVGSGLSDVELGLRLRYEIVPEFAPYIGVHHERKVGDSADFARAAGDSVRDTRVVIGVRTWF